MHHDTVVILGIPVDNLTMDEAMARIFQMIEAYARDGRARQVATVNVDFLVNANAWLGSHVRHPELLDILRRADLVTADGMPIVWASRLMGAPLKERVAGADLVPRLAMEASTRGKSIFFLGGKGDVAEQAALVLQNRHPALHISGVYAPFVHVEGESLLGAEAEDREIVDRINRSHPDILLIGFGNPKQEIWFERNRSRLQVPVSIGIGGTYEFIVGTVSRAPRWMQTAGLEWLYRISQDPRRLIKRYVVGFFKFGFMIGPALLYYRYRIFLRKLTGTGGSGPEHLALEGKGIGGIRVVQFPDRVDAAYVKESADAVQRLAASTTHLVFDFGRTSFIDSSGLGLVARLWKEMTEHGKGLYLMNLNPPVIHLLKLNRLWRLFSQNVTENLGQIIDNLKQTRQLPSFYMLVAKDAPEFLVLKLSGRLDANQMAMIDMEDIISGIGHRNCILDLKGLEFIDSSGLVFFLKVQKALVRKNQVCLLCDVNENVLQMLRITRLVHLFTVAPDVESAKKALR